jgi:CRP/FNR family transcriptional regulator, cyclic AMP receptor protein
MTDSEAMAKLKFAANDTIFREGEPGNAAYMVTKGEVEIRTGTLGPTPRKLTTIHRGGTFGELALCLDSPRSASAIATQETELVSVSREGLLEILEETNPVVKALMVNLGKRIVELTDELEVGGSKINWHQWRKNQ